MTLTHIAVFIILAIITRLWKQTAVSGWVIMIAGIIFVFWLQPVSSIRSLEFWLPTVLFGIVIICWSIVTPPEIIHKPENKWSVLAAGSVILLITGLRYTGIQWISKFVNPPVIWQVLIYGALVACLALAIIKASRGRKYYAIGIVTTLLIIFILLKYQPAALQISRIWRQLNGQSTKIAGAFEFAWVGYSYFAFRLLHVLREWQQGRQSTANLKDFILYITFFPSFTAGPIDRLEHFQKELATRDSREINEDFLEGGKRIGRGLLLKFILADSLAMIAINPASATQVTHSGWLWVMVYAYAFRLYFDFSGYTDIAIGISRLMGIRLPENFNRPYLAENVTVFWNRWHMTLTQWFRTYYFNPVTRFLRSHEKALPAAGIILFTQLSTMILIALWHGISLNFVLWGVWNGIGLFIHNRWAEWQKDRAKQSDNTSKRDFPSTVRKYVSIFATFNFIALGWIWFAIPEFSTSLRVFAQLFGGQ
jgi:D-alanyl-lipoteichoic acid acyltransferase DltB (MBOAT superfamily)